MPDDLLHHTVETNTYETQRTVAWMFADVAGNFNDVMKVKM